MRRLQTSRHTIPLDRIEEYLGAWCELRDTVAAVGGRAWLFRDPRREDHYLEFVEFADASVLEHATRVAEAREALDDLFGHAPVEEWDEAPTEVTGV
jgi:hypothetical protein